MVFETVRSLMKNVRDGGARRRIYKEMLSAEPDLDSAPVKMAADLDPAFAAELALRRAKTP
jgi:hypothetical protein